MRKYRKNLFFTVCSFKKYTEINWLFNTTNSNTYSRSTVFYYSLRGISFHILTHTKQRNSSGHRRLGTVIRIKSAKLFFFFNVEPLNMHFMNCQFHFNQLSELKITAESVHS